MRYWYLTFINIICGKNSRFFTFWTHLEPPAANMRGQDTKKYYKKNKKLNFYENL